MVQYKFDEYSIPVMWSLENNNISAKTMSGNIISLTTYDYFELISSNVYDK